MAGVSGASESRSTLRGLAARGWFLLALVPAGVAVWYVQGFALDVPVLDEFVLVDLYGRIASGHATLADFLAPHNRVHVAPVTRALFAAVAFATNLSFRAEVLLEFALTLLTVWLLYRTASELEDPKQDRTRSDVPLRAATIFAAFLSFSPAMHDAWTWSLVLAHVFENTCVAGAIYALSRRAPWPKAAMVLCVLLSFGRIEGLLSWVLFLPLLFLAFRAGRVGRRVLWTWGLLGALCVFGVLFSIVNYQPEGSRLPLMEGGRGEALGYRLLFIPSLAGATPTYFLRAALPRVVTTHAFFPAGFVVLAVLGWLTFLTLRDRPMRERAAPFVALGSFALMFAIATSVGGGWVSRQWGYPEDSRRSAITDAYMAAFSTTGAFIPIAVAYLFAALVSSKQRLFGLSSGALGRFSCALGACLLGLNYAYALPSMQRERQDGQWDANCVELLAYTADLNGCGMGTEHLRQLERAGLRTIRHDVSFVEDGPRGGTLFGHEATGIPGPHGLHTVVWGSARLPDPSKGAVLLAYEDRKFVARGSRFYANGEDTIWSAELPDDLFTADRGALRGWLYERDTARFLPLNGVIYPSSAAMSPSRVTSSSRSP